MYRLRPSPRHAWKKGPWLPEPKHASCLPGDTTSEFFELATEDVFKARLLILECSFVDDRVGVEEVGHRMAMDGGGAVG